jgi:cytochrome P450
LKLFGFARIAQSAHRPHFEVRPNPVARHGETDPLQRNEVNMSSAFRFQDIFVRGVQGPYPFYHWLRTEAPVYWNAEIVPAWFISRYDDVVAITEDDRRFGNRGGLNQPSKTSGMVVSGTPKPRGFSSPTG